jgi:hypothetical protein
VVSFDVRFGSKASPSATDGRRSMSAMSPLATEIAWRCNMARWASSGRLRHTGTRRRRRRIFVAAAADCTAPSKLGKLLTGLTQAISDSHFQPPIEVTDPIGAPVNSTSPWMVCIRSAQSEETRRITYTAFFKDGYTGSHY